MRVVLAVGVVVVGSVAIAGPPPSGTYELERGSPQEITFHKPGDKRGQLVKPCDPEDPVPEHLTIRYWAPDDVIVNGLGWKTYAYSTRGPDGPIADHPLRLAAHPSPPPDTAITVAFRADGDDAWALFEVGHYNAAKTELVCVTAYSFRGTFTPSN